MAYLFVYVFLALPTGVLFLWISFFPGAFAQPLGVETVPVLVRGISAVFGVILSAASLWALRHGLRLQRIVRTGEPEPVQVSVSMDEGGDTTTYIATVSTVGPDATWLTPIYYNKAVGRLLEGSARTVEAWRDDGNGAPIALRVDGSPVFTYPQATRTHRTIRS